MDTAWDQLLAVKRENIVTLVQNMKIFPLTRLSDLIWKISLNYVWQAGRKTTFSQFAPPASPYWKNEDIDRSGNL